jgi:hypothetical protein
MSILKYLTSNDLSSFIFFNLNFCKSFQIKYVLVSIYNHNQALKNIRLLLLF